MTDDTWQLWYDHNGTDTAGGQTLVATFDTNANLDTADITGEA